MNSETLGFEDIKKDLHALGYQEVNGIPCEGSHADENGNWQTWTPVDYRCLLNIAMHFYKVGLEENNGFYEDAEGIHFYKAGVYNKDDVLRALDKK